MILDFAELCPVLYVLIGDHYRALPTALRPRGEQAACSDSELMTMLNVSECMGRHRETEHVRQWAGHPARRTRRSRGAGRQGVHERAPRPSPACGARAALAHTAAPQRADTRTPGAHLTVERVATGDRNGE